MSALIPAGWRAPLFLLAVCLLTPAVRAQVNLGSNPTVAPGASLTLNPTDFFTGTLTVGAVGQNFGTLSLGGNYTSLLPIVLTGNQSSLNNSGGTFTLTLGSTGSLTRTGGVTGNYSTVFANLSNAGNIVINSGTLYDYGTINNFNSVVVSNAATLTQQPGSSATFTNTGTVNITGTGSSASLINPVNPGGTIVADANGLLQLAGNFATGNLGTINLTAGGSVEITGNLDNTGGNLTGPTGGVYTLNGGSIKNGFVVDTGFSTKSGTLDGVSVLGNITIGTNSLTLKNNAGATNILSVGTVNQNFGTLSLGSNDSTPAGSSVVLTGNQSSLNNSGGTFTLTVVPTSSLTRTGGVTGNYSTVFANLVNQGNIVVNSGTLYDYGTLNNQNSVVVSNGANLIQQPGSSATFTNTGTANITGAGSSASLIGLINTGGTLIADASAVLQLAGNFVTGNIGTINLTNGGSVEITGNLDNTGATLVAPNGGGYVLNGGTIKNGNVVDTAFTPKSGTLDGALVQGNITVGTNSIILKNNAGANLTTSVGTVGQNFGTLSLGSNGSTPAGGSFVLTGNQSSLNNSGGIFTLTVVPTSSLTRTGGVTGNYSTVFANLLNQGNIVVNSGTLYDYGTLNNQSSVVVSNGANIIQQPGSSATFTNSGTVNITGAGSSASLINAINTGGTLIADASGLLSLGGNFVTGNLGAINLTTGGSVEITGNLDNTGATLVAPTGGAYTLNGGTIKNGNIVETAFTPKSGTLDGALVQGNLTVGTNSLILKSTAGANLTTTVGSLSQNFGTLSLGSNLNTLPGSSLVLTGNQSSLNNSGGTFTLNVAATSTLTRTGNATGTYSTVFANLNNSGNIVVNQGTLYDYGTFNNQSSLVVSNGATLTQQPGSSANFTSTGTGTANVTGAGSTLSLLKPVNSGTLIADTGGLLQLGGNFTTGALGNIVISGAGAPGFVEITGNLDNTGTTLTPPTGGAYSLSGVITNGTIVDTALAEKSGILDNATILGDFALMGGANAQSLTLRNGAGFTGNATIGTAGQNGGTLYLGSPLTLAANSTLSVTGSTSSISYNNGQTTLTVAPTSSFIRTGIGATSIQDHLVNQGAVTINGGSLNAQDVTNSASLTVAAGTSFSAATGLTQTAGTLKVDGSLFPSSNPGLVVQGGSVTGSGTIQGTTHFTGGTLDPGSTIGTLSFVGNLTLTGSATTNLELGTGTNNDRIIVSGSGNGLVFGGTLNVFAVSVTAAQSWTVFTAPGNNFSGSFATINLPNTANGWVWDTSQLTTTGALTLTTFVPLPVPEPSTYALLATGLGFIVLLRRRRAR